MKKGKTMYLVIAIILFIILMIPYFQNTMTNPPMQLFWVNTTLLSGYMWVMAFGIGL